MRTILAVVLLLATVPGCGDPLKKLTATEQDHYYALKVFMDEGQRKTYLKLKTEAERNAYLTELGLWDKFYKYDAETRDAIVAGEPKLGWTEDRLFMAWGNPVNRERLTGRPAARSERLTWRFEVDDEGYVRVWVPGSKTEYSAVRKYRVEVILDDSRITEMTERDGWE